MASPLLVPSFNMLPTFIIFEAVKLLLILSADSVPSTITLPSNSAVTTELKLPAVTVPAFDVAAPGRNAACLATVIFLPCVWCQFDWFHVSLQSR